ncbi:MAG: penicillin-binding transpeptidase domain-containing protein [Actinomycetota bacterium]|nr:penicillin-binding transpeptidase domain-containing protein [Actinomycetota bacterium]
MAKLVDRPPADFVAFNRAVVTDLGIRHADYVAGRATQKGRQATVPLRNHFVLGTFGAWTARGVLKLTQRGGRWRVDWSPQSIDTSLQPGSHLVTKVQWPDRAPILGAGGTSLTVAAPMVTVGVQGSRITDAGSLTSALEGAGATPAQVSAGLGTAAAHPQWFVPVFDLPEAQYQQLRPTLYPIPGTVFQTHASRQAITPDLSVHVVGSVGPITAEELGKLGAPYQANNTVGQTGIEEAYEHQLAGRPGGSIQVVDPAGNVASTLASFSAKTGAPLQTTIDPAVQGAGEQALNGVPQSAALVAMRASTGEVVAAVSSPTSQSPDIALTGQYPPGSTFKVVTTADLLEHGLTPSSPASCPQTITVGGQTFHNFEGEAATSLSLGEAFARSCNAAFIGLATNLPNPSFTATAQHFGLGVTPRLGLNAFGGAVPTPTSDAERGATAIGQANVVVSPLAMATVAAAVDAGSLHEPRLVGGAADDTKPAQPLDPNVASGLQTMMAAVVTNGTAAGAGLPAGTHGKTGTAEYGTANPPQTHAWFIGYRGDLAVAVIVTGGGIGGTIAAPIAAKFLNATASG